MGFRFRKTIKTGPVNINLSQSGVGYSVGAGGVRYTHSPKKKRKAKGSKTGGSKGIWRIAIGVFFIIGGMGNIATNFGVFAFGVVVGALLLFWGIKARKQ